MDKLESPSDAISSVSGGELNSQESIDNQNLNDNQELEEEKIPVRIRPKRGEASSVEDPCSGSQESKGISVGHIQISNSASEYAVSSSEESFRNINEKVRRLERLKKNRDLLHRIINYHEDEDPDSCEEDVQVARRNNLTFEANRVSARFGYKEADEEEKKGLEETKEPASSGKSNLSMVLKVRSKLNENRRKRKRNPDGVEEESYEEFVRRKTIVPTQNGLDYAAMKDRITRHHPYAEIGDKKVKYPICKTRTGWSSIFERLRITDLKDLGVGVSLYFKFTKYLMVIYLLMIFITLPNLIFYILGGTQEFENGTSIKTLFGLTTLGNLGSAETMCDSTNSFSSEVYLFCRSGTLDKVEILGKIHPKGSTCLDNGQNLAVDSTCDYRAFDQTDQDTVDTSFSNQCKGAKTCNFNLAAITFPSSCSGEPYIRVACKSEEIIGIQKKTMSLVLVILDIVGIYIFWFFVQRHGSFEYLEEEIFGSDLTGRDFTVMIKNLPGDQDPRVLKSKLWLFLENLLAENPDQVIRLQDDPNAHKLVDINFGMSDFGVMHFYLKRTQFTKQEAVLNVKISILIDTEMEPKPKQKKIRALRKKLAKVIKAKVKNERAYQKFKETYSQQVVKAFVTCQSMEGKL
ncbi:unnamed protein product [Moneuplotes crassus]|uniref:Uncharacterized protein n=1 Tax=Euplotes crassus TaxID=5936 RepID=A0AAD1XE40_EUPCR|nr:unnamed protein product [Moneuplotes crassus]